MQGTTIERQGTAKSRLGAAFNAFIALVLCAGLTLPAGLSPQAAFADDAVSQTGHSVACYREEEYGTAPNGVESSDGMHILVELDFEAAVSIDDAEALDESLCVELNGTDIKESGSVDSYTIYAEGDSLCVDLLISYAPFAGRVAVSAVDESGLLDGVSVGGASVQIEAFETLADTGLEFEAVEVIEGTATTCASTTFEVTQSAFIRSMNHVIWLSSAGSEDGTGHSIIANSGGYTQSTVAHHHNFWSFTPADSAAYIVDGAADTLAEYGYTLTDNYDGTFTITADEPVEGEILWATNYTDSFFNETGLAYGEDVVGVEMPEPTIISAGEHRLSAVAAVDATCTEAGNSAYYECIDCGLLFADTEAEVETTLEAVTIPAVGHSIVYVEASEPGCGEEGCIAHYECSVCGACFADAEGAEELDAEDVSIPATGEHSIVYMEAAEASCTEDGCIAHYECENCGACFADAEGAEELADEEVFIAALGHDYVVTASAEASCTEDGSTSYTCSRCGDSYTETTAAFGHDYQAVETVEAGCEEDGYVLYVCVNCSDVYSEAIAATGHDFAASWAWSEDYDSATLTLSCFNCDSVVSGIAGEVSRTTNSDGSVTYTATASYDGVEYSSDVTLSGADAGLFTDVADSSLYYFEAVYALADEGIITGVSDTLYGVGQNMTRAQFATIVWRIAGEPATSHDAGYKDVAEGKYYTEAVNWAAAEGVVTGYTNGKFGVNDTLSFEDMCLIIARYAEGGNDALQSAVTDAAAAKVLAAFADGDAVAAYADNGMAWCVEQGLVSGNTDGTIAPQENVPRQRAAVVVARWQGLVD